MSWRNPPFSTTGIYEDGWLLLALDGELDIATAPDLRRAVGDLIGPGLRAVTLDLTGLTFVDVLGLRAFLDIKQIAARAHADFRLRAVSDLTRRVIRLTGFDELEHAVERV